MFLEPNLGKSGRRCGWLWFSQLLTKCYCCTALKLSDVVIWSLQSGLPHVAVASPGERRRLLLAPTPLKCLGLLRFCASCPDALKRAEMLGWSYLPAALFCFFSYVPPCPALSLHPRRAAGYAVYTSNNSQTSIALYIDPLFITLSLS